MGGQEVLHISYKLAGFLNISRGVNLGFYRLDLHEKMVKNQYSGTWDSLTMIDRL